ncbi:MAG TPA: NDP-sugar synthase [Polyangia bacterium]|nr:NDP-sugar synthase [Polyangia bacterium]
MKVNVMLLAAGRSTRLGALGATLPKPLVPICGHPAIAFGLAACARAGVTRAVVNLFHHGELLRATLGVSTCGVELDYSVEEELLGTGGGLAHARGRLGPGPLLVMNGKVVADLDLAGFVGAHARGGAVATMLLRDDPDARRWGAISADETGRVVGILDVRSPRPPEGRVTERMFTGIHVLEPALLDRLRPVFSDVIRDAYIPALLAGETIRAEVLPGYFAEHSTPERYLAGNLALLREPSLVPHAPGPLVGVDAGARVEPGARVVGPCRIEAGAVIQAGAEIGPDVVVGRGARVAAGIRLARAVVWPESVVARGGTDLVVTPEGVVAI